MKPMLFIILIIGLAGCAGKSADYQVQQYRENGVVHCTYSRNGEVIGEITGKELDVKEGALCPKF